MTQERDYDSDTDEVYVELVDKHGDRYWSGTYGLGYGLDTAVAEARLDCLMELRAEFPDGYEFRVRPIGAVTSVHPFKGRGNSED